MVSGPPNTRFPEIDHSGKNLPELQKVPFLQGCSFVFTKTSLAKESVWRWGLRAQNPSSEWGLLSGVYHAY
jgi:hypothetical protein